MAIKITLDEVMRWLKSVKASATNPEDPSSILGPTWWKVRTDSLHGRAESRTLLYIHTSTHKINKCKKFKNIDKNTYLTY